jgi:hypothetical protein
VTVQDIGETMGLVSMNHFAVAVGPGSMNHFAVAAWIQIESALSANRIDVDTSPWTIRSADSFSQVDPGNPSPVRPTLGPWRRLHPDNRALSVERCLTCENNEEPREQTLSWA